MPFIAHSRKATTDLVGELLAEFARPLSYSFVADDDTPSGQQFLHHAQTEWEAEIQPHGMADDLGREPVPAVTGVSGRRHPSRLLTPASPRKRGKPAKLTVPYKGLAVQRQRQRPAHLGIVEGWGITVDDQIGVGIRGPQLANRLRRLALDISQ